MGARGQETGGEKMREFFSVLIMSGAVFAAVYIAMPDTVNLISRGDVVIDQRGGGMRGCK